jgi:hypothetical protein
MLRAVSSRLMARVTNKAAASGNPPMTTAMTVSRMMFTFTPQVPGGPSSGDVCWRSHQSDVPAD